MTKEASEVLRLVGALRPLKPAKRVGIASLLVAGLLSLALGMVTAFSQAPEQVAERELGIFDYVTTYPAFFSIGKHVPIDEIEGALAAAKPTSVLTVTNVFGLDFRELPEQRRLLLQEADWAHAMAELSQYTITSGRLPERPGEVLVSQRLQGPNELSALGGRSTFKVVGTFLNDYQRASTVILAAPGTWSQIGRVTGAAARYPSLQSSVQVFWPGADADNVAKRLQTLSGIRADEAGTLSRAELLTDPINIRLTWFPLILAIPISLIPLLTGSVGGYLTGRWCVGVDAQLNRLGVPLRSVRRASRVLISIRAASWASAGWIIGLSLAWTVRPLVNLIADHQLGPLTLFLSEYVVVTGGLVVATLFGHLLGTGPVWSMPVGAARAARVTSILRPYVALASLIVFVVTGIGQQDPRSASTMAAAAILAVVVGSPPVSRRLLMAFPIDTMRSLLAIRMLRSQFGSGRSDVRSAGGHLGDVAYRNFHCVCVGRDESPPHIRSRASRHCSDSLLRSRAAGAKPSAD